MKIGMLVVGAVMLFGAPAWASKDEDALKKAQDDFAAAWGKDDAKAMAAMFAEDAELTNPAGRVAKGRAEVEKLFAEEHGGPLKGSKMVPSACTVRLLKPDVGVVKCNFEVTGAKGPDGKPFPLKGMYTMVSTKQGDKWLVSVGQAMVPLQPPGPPAAPPAPVK